MGKKQSPDEDVAEFKYPAYDHELEDTSDPSDEASAYVDVADGTSSLVKSCLTHISSDDVFKIKRVNIHENSILACSYQSRTIYLLLDTGATASSITHKMANLLNLKIYRTGYKAVQVNGEAQLPVLGEVHSQAAHPPPVQPGGGQGGQDARSDS